MTVDDASSMASYDDPQDLLDPSTASDDQGMRIRANFDFREFGGE
jgi:hypothetical protein